MKLSNSIVITGIKKPTKAEFFRSLKPGDIVHIYIPFKKPGTGSGGSLYATNVVLSNENDSASMSITAAINRLDCFDWTEYSSGANSYWVEFLTEYHAAIYHGDNNVAKYETYNKFDLIEAEVYYTKNTETATLRLCDGGYIYCVPCSAFKASPNMDDYVYEH